jgi:site-specific DNA recombinase
MSDTPLKAALYFRQSVDTQEGIERQRTRCRHLASAREWDVIDEYVDNDVSATKSRGEGTAWSKMLTDAADGKIDVVVAVNLDRLLRTQKDLIALMETGTLVTTLEGEIDLASASGEMQATVLTAMARFEARRKGERQIRANKDRAANGLRSGGRRPFGYEVDGTTLREDERAAVEDGYKSFLAGVPLAAIARSWGARGLFTTQMRYKGLRDANDKLVEASPWTANAVRLVLSSPRYMGKRAHLGEIVADAKWPAIVDESTWQAVNAILRHPERRKAPKRGRYLLSGLALCGVCGSKVHAGGNARRGTPGYRCSGSSGHFARRSIPVEEYVEEIMIARLSAPDASLLTLKKNKAPDHEAMSLELLGIRERLEAIALDYADGAITSSQLRTATERLRERHTEIEVAQADAGRVDILGDIVNASDVRAVWDALLIERKRGIIDALAVVRLHPVGRGTRNFNPDTVGIEWLS